MSQRPAESTPEQPGRPSSPDVLAIVTIGVMGLATVWLLSVRGGSFSVSMPAAALTVAVNAPQ